MSTRSRKRSMSIFVAILSSVSAFAFGEQTSQLAIAQENVEPARDIHRYERYDPVGDRVIAIAKEELKVGLIYRHYSKRLGRRVWSYVEGIDRDGDELNVRFWYAFGPGTTQQGRRFDVSGTREELLEEFGRLNPRAAEYVARSVNPPMFILDTQDEWELKDTTSIPSIFNAEKGHRWERHSKTKYVRVSSLSGYRWIYRSGRYVPARASRPQTAVRLYSSPYCSLAPPTFTH